MRDDSPDPLFTKAGDSYLPSAFAAGPFENLHGGAGAAIMAAAALQEVPEEFVPVSSRSEFFRSTPIGPFSMRTNVVNSGRRHRIVDVVIADETGTRESARSSVTFYNPTPTDLLDPSAIKPWGGHTDPTTLPTLPDMPAPSGAKAWMIAATDVRSDMKGVYWFRWRGPLLTDGSSHWFTRLLGPADWVGGFIAPKFPMPTKIGVWPNTDLTVHVDRPLEGEWIGLRPQGGYRPNGYGLGHAQLIDQNGVLGHALASTISPLTKKAIIQDV